MLESKTKTKKKQKNKTKKGGGGGGGRIKLAEMRRAESAAVDVPNKAIKYDGQHFSTRVQFFGIHCH